MANLAVGQGGLNVVSPSAVLVSGGLDSAILVGALVCGGVDVHPLYVRSGFVWEAEELEALRGYLKAIAAPSLRALIVLDEPVADLLPGHWSVNGQGVPDAESPDEAVYLPGRNVLLLAKAILWCHLNGVGSVCLGTLSSNPFSDATADFFDGYARAVNHAIGGQVQVVRPFAHLHKQDVMRLGASLPLELSFSCIRPVGGRHCGRCNKCAERRRAFADSGIRDRTRYAADSMSPLA
ncbi:MAG: 7-cyano-7-deazaguanine synthase [Isosphaeraceae bacterium]|jgi:7-cyano-7-deazaguanine synthase|nr:MAG: 7-cyano-7-deazaguanine synthase [Isosphaeraceae bacterium]